jgi:hypothetical protein
MVTLINYLFIIMAFISEELFEKIIAELYENDDFFTDEHPFEQEIDIDSKILIAEMNSLYWPKDADLILAQYFPVQFISES